jgi:hypothetical protein
MKSDVHQAGKQGNHQTRNSKPSFTTLLGGKKSKDAGDHPTHKVQRFAKGTASD